MLFRILVVLLLAVPTVSWCAEPDAVQGGEPQIDKHVKPVYPPEAKQAGIEGSVELEAVVGKDGKVRTVNVLNGESILAGAATAAVRQWEYRPVLLNGNPVEVVTQITVNFALAK